MTLARSLLIGVTACCAAPGLAQSQAEWLVQGPLPELVVGYQAEQAGSSIVEQIPPGETVQDWSRMATTQRFAGTIAQGISLETWVGNFLGGIGQGCPGFRANEPRFGTADGRPNVEFRVDCPLNPATGRPETFLLRAFAGAADLHVVQVAFRHEPNAGEVRWAQRHLATARLCNPASEAAQCRR